MFRLFGLLVLVLDIIALVSLLQSGADTATKILWALLIICLPVARDDPVLPHGPGPAEGHLRTR